MWEYSEVECRVILFFSFGSVDTAFVPFQRAWLSEWALAHVALVGTDVLVPHVVHDQARAACERLAAVAKLADVVGHRVGFALSDFDFLIVVSSNRSHVHLLRICGKTLTLLMMILELVLFLLVRQRWISPAPITNKQATQLFSGSPIIVGMTGGL